MKGLFVVLSKLAGCPASLGSHGIIRLDHSQMKKKKFANEEENIYLAKG